MPTRIKFALPVVLLLACCSFAWAEKIADIHPQGYVTDLAQVIDPATKAKLETLCAEVEQKTGAQIAVVTVNSLDGRTREDYAADLYKQLGVGIEEGEPWRPAFAGAQGASVQDRGWLRIRAGDQRCSRWRHRAGDGARSAQRRLQRCCTPRYNACCPTHSSGQGCAVEWCAGQSAARACLRDAVVDPGTNHCDHLPHRPRPFALGARRGSRTAVGRRRRVGPSMASDGQRLGGPWG